jgi:predicted nucleic acid-binding protein
MKIFLDTSVLLSALIADSGVCHDLLHTLHTSQSDPFDRFICMSSPRVLQELKDLEGIERDKPSKFGWSSFHTDAAAALFTDDYKLTPTALAPIPSKDEDDGWILADVGTMRICTPREMLLWLRTGIPIPKFEAHQDRAEYLLARQ